MVIFSWWCCSASFNDIITFVDDIIQFLDMSCCSSGPAPVGVLCELLTERERQTWQRSSPTEVRGEAEGERSRYEVVDSISEELVAIANYGTNDKQCIYKEEKDN